MSATVGNPGRLPVPPHVPRAAVRVQAGPPKVAAAQQPRTRMRARAVLLAALLLGGGLTGVVGYAYMQNAAAKGTFTRQYVGEVEVAVTTLTLVFAQADETMKAFQNGWLAPEGAASQFGFLHGQVRDIKAGITKAQPPADMANFHRQLGRSVSLTQQAMDAMQSGFESGDASFFQLAQQKIQEARATLSRANEAL